VKTVVPVHVTTMSGRSKGISFTCPPEQSKTLAQHRRGEADRVSTTIVTTAERTGRGISLEELKGIRGS
jgi:hypothetical protein